MATRSDWIFNAYGIISIPDIFNLSKLIQCATHLAYGKEISKEVDRDLNDLDDLDDPLPAIPSQNNLNDFSADLHPSKCLRSESSKNNMVKMTQKQKRNEASHHWCAAGCEEGCSFRPPT